MIIELYHSPHCPACRALDRGLAPSLTVQRRDAGRHLETVARLGASRLPALIVDGRLHAQGATVPAALAALAGAGAAP